MQIRISSDGVATVTLTVLEKRKLDASANLLKTLVKHGNDRQSKLAAEALTSMDALFESMEPGEEG